MGLFLTLLYILTAYLGPETLWGPLYEFHIEIILAALALAASLPGLQRSKIFSVSQSYALIGMCVAVFCSMVMTGWLGSVMPAVLSFIPNAFSFFLVAINCRKKIHIQLVILVLFFASAFSIYQGYTALRTGDYLSPYLLSQGNDEGQFFYRLRGLSFIHDPNDFSQLLVSLIPCLFFFWKKGSGFKNYLFVLPSVALLIFGMFLTHSRGGMIALLAVILFAFRRKIGTVPAAIIACGLFALTSVIGWSGGRDVSMEAGAGRMEAWAVGFDLLKAHPIFGVGFGRFGEYFFITAHNTIVVCAAELGLFGLFWWVMFVIPTVRDAMVFSQPKQKKAEEDNLPSDGSFGLQRNSTASLHWQPSYGGAQPESHGVAVAEQAPPVEAIAAPMHLGMEAETSEAPPEEEIRRLARLMLTCLVGYLLAGWFLSRAYVMTLFIYGGLVQAIYAMAVSRNIAPPKMKAAKVLQYSAIGSFGLLFVVYLMLRFQHLVEH